MGFIEPSLCLSRLYETQESSMFVDDKTGDKLDEKLVKKAEEEEIDFMIKIELGVE